MVAPISISKGNLYYQVGGRLRFGHPSLSSPCTLYFSDPVDLVFDHAQPQPKSEPNPDRTAYRLSGPGIYSFGTEVGSYPYIIHIDDQSTYGEMHIKVVADRLYARCRAEKGQVVLTGHKMFEGAPEIVLSVSPNPNGADALRVPSETTRESISPWDLGNLEAGSYIISLRETRTGPLPPSVQSDPDGDTQVILGEDADLEVSPGG